MTPWCLTNVNLIKLWQGPFLENNDHSYPLAKYDTHPSHFWSTFTKSPKPLKFHPISTSGWHFKSRNTLCKLGTGTTEVSCGSLFLIRRQWNKETSYWTPYIQHTMGRQIQENCNRWFHSQREGKIGATWSHWSMKVLRSSKAQLPFHFVQKAGNMLTRT